MVSYRVVLWRAVRTSRPWDLLSSSGMNALPHIGLAAHLLFACDRGLPGLRTEH